MRFRKCFLAVVIAAASLIINACDARLIGLTLKPSKYDFGFVDRTLDKSHFFRLKNQIDTQVQILSIDMIGDNPDEFSIMDEPTTPFTLQAFDTILLNVVFAPKTAGQKVAHLVIQSSFEHSKILRVDLNGFCHSAEFNPPNFDFGSIDLGGKIQSLFTFENKTNRKINVTTIELLDNSNPSVHYNLISGTPNVVKAMTGILDIEVEFEPKNFGTKNLSLTVKTDDVTFSEVVCTVVGFGNLELFEEFDNTTMCDTANTTAEWSTLTAGKLIPTGMSSFGLGSDGKYNPTTSTTLDANGSPYEFSEICIPSGVTITVIGSQPLEILCQGNVIVEGEIILDGKNGQNAGNGGAGGPGGYAGGNGGTVDTGTAGGGPGGGQASVDRSGGGAGYAVNGQDGFSGGFFGASGGTAYGTADLAVIDGGSGGGGGAVDPNTYYANYTGGGPGGGGGGGGGALFLTAAGDVEIRGLISANGGDGGGHVRPGNSTAMCFGGGGGSGGAVKIICAADIKFDGGIISVLGGWGNDGMVYANTDRNRGGYGSPGRIRLEDSDGVIDGIGGYVYPAPSCQFVSNGFAGGTGADGAFNPQNNITLDTTNGPFNYSSVNIQTGIVVTVTGSNPLEIFSTGNIEITGTINVSGESANYKAGALGTAGGGNGGDGGAGMTNGLWGQGTGGGRGGSGSTGWGGASGGGFGTAGQKGSRDLVNPGGVAYGSEDLDPLLGGSGGGGGGGDYSDPTYDGGGGGAGAGAVRLQAARTITITSAGKVIADGGRGGWYGGNFALPGAGGSGGGLLIQGEKLVILGTISARGGPGGDVAGVIGGYPVQGDEPPNFTASWGGEGRIRLEAKMGNLGGLLYTTKGKYSSPAPPGINPEYIGTCTIELATLQAGLIAQSLWFDSTIDDPVWQDAVLTGDYTNQIKVYYEGAEDDGAGIPDPNTLTGWKDNPVDVGNPRFIRFKLVFVIGINKPELDRIELPFTE